jgi:hypothetical protein
VGWRGHAPELAEVDHGTRAASAAFVAGLAVPSAWSGGEGADVSWRVDRRQAHARLSLPSWVRAHAALLIDLAFAHAVAGDKDAAFTHALASQQLAEQIHSDRRLRRVAALFLPSDRSAIA